MIPVGNQNEGRSSGWWTEELCAGRKSFKRFTTEGEEDTGTEKGGKEGCLYSPILILHVCAGLVSLVAGGAAPAFRKGSERHGKAGTAFVVAMICMAGAGTLMAVMKMQTGNILGGTMTLYLVVTGWMAVQRADGRSGAYDWGAFVAALGIGGAAMMMSSGIGGAPGRGESAGQFVFLGSVALIGATGDLRMLWRGGMAASRRLARHLWRMCFALFIASSSLFLARQQFFPAVMRKTGVLWLLSFLPLICMVWWVVRLRWTKGSKRKAGVVVGQRVPLVGA